MTQKYMANNGQVIKQCIKDMHITQAKFAELTDTDERTVRKWIQKGVFDYRLLVKIANIFGCPVGDLFLEK